MTGRLGNLRQRVVDRAPVPLLTHAHETALAVALAILGMAILMGEVRPGSVAAQVPWTVRDGWGFFMLGGGAFTLHGLFQNRPRAEWVGQMLTGWGCAFYAAVLLWSVPLEDSGAVVAAFAVLGVVGFWRAFKITSAPLIQARLTKAAREAHVRVEGSKP